MNIYKSLVLGALALSQLAFAENSMEIKVGYNLGGTSPLPIPATIRSIDSFKPGVSFDGEVKFTHWMGEHLGVAFAARYQNKKMIARATTKQYHMRLLNDVGGALEGPWTGGVETEVNNHYGTVPIMAVYHISDRWQTSLGPYVSYLIKGNFRGKVYDGYLRSPDEYGVRVDFYDDNTAEFDFSDEQRNFCWGFLLGGDYRAWKALHVYADLTWGVSDIFQNSFDAISFKMYPIYLNFGVAYAFGRY